MLYLVALLREMRTHARAQRCMCTRRHTGRSCGCALASFLRAGGTFPHLCRWGRPTLHQRHVPTLPYQPAGDRLLGCLQLFAVSRERARLPWNFSSALHRDFVVFSLPAGLGSDSAGLSPRTLAPAFSSHWWSPWALPMSLPCTCRPTPVCACVRVGARVCRLLPCVYVCVCQLCYRMCACTCAGCYRVSVCVRARACRLLPCVCASVHVCARAHSHVSPADSRTPVWEATVRARGAAGSLRGPRPPRRPQPRSPALPRSGGVSRCLPETGAARAARLRNNGSFQPPRRRMARRHDNQHCGPSERPGPGAPRPSPVPRRMVRVALAAAVQRRHLFVSRG